MNSNQIIQIIRDSASLLKQDFDGLALSEIDSSPRGYTRLELAEFKRDLIEAANKQRIIYLDNQLPFDEFATFIQEVEIPIVAFEDSGKDLVPIIIYKQNRELQVLRLGKDASHTFEYDVDYSRKLYMEDEKVQFMGVFSYQSLVSDDPEDGEKTKKLSPVQRLIRLLSEEKRDIFYIYVYAVLVGLISLTLPLGIQATVSLISGGVVFSSVYVLIGLVIAGVLATGGLQVMQITLVEYLQRRVFTKAAFEFAFRVPRIKAEALLNYYPPELMNRFFDVLT
ncbi:MAG: ABC transporter ATP-binding protein, partial [Fulvivirga sp.]